MTSNNFNQNMNQATFSGGESAPQEYEAAGYDEQHSSPLRQPAGHTTYQPCQTSPQGPRPGHSGGGAY